MDSDKILFTCLSCSIAFISAEEQRVHYRSDFHRYNMKRRVASLPPVSASVFDNKVLERKAETAVMASTKDSTCDICNKIYTTEGAYRSHINSKRHRENEIKAASASNHPATSPQLLPTLGQIAQIAPSAEANPALTEPSSTDEEIERSIDEKIAAARARLSPTDCLFCSHFAGSLEDNVAHMSHVHSFFIPDADYLIDISGLITYLGEKIAVGNICIFCNDKGREFRSLEAVRRHMVDKSHCKVAYDSADDRLELSDYYDFTSSYPDAESRKEKTKRALKELDDDNWEDIESDNATDVDEIVDVTDSEESELDNSDNGITYGDSHLELVLPSGTRIGHRSMRRYYAQSFPGAPRGNEDPNSGAALVRRLLADKNSAIVSRKGGFGAFGSGTDVVKARNRGEAREAGRHVREFRDQKRREEFKTKVGFIHNSQKHYRDPLLQ
ncbi:hypothetical protein H0H93_010235 [Arthromyces matolae]|nr:hypothetical protein H0H93_010235 [Arthromyces matolae]